MTGILRGGGRSKSYIAGGVSRCSKIVKINKGTLQLQLFPWKYTGVGGNNAVACHKQNKSDCIDCISHDHKMSQIVLSGCDTPKKVLEGIGSNREQCFQVQGCYYIGFSLSVGQKRQRILHQRTCNSRDYSTAVAKQETWYLYTWQLNIIPIPELWAFASFPVLKHHLG